MFYPNTLSRPMILMVLAAVTLFVVSAIVAIAPKVSLISLPPPTTLERLPLAFIPNQGQLDTNVRLQVQARGGTLSFLQDEVLFHLNSTTRVQLQWENANPVPQVAGVNRLPGVANIMRGNNPAGWHTDLPMYGGTSYTGLYPGIDLQYDGNEGTLKGTYTVAPGADPAAIRWRFMGSETLVIDPDTGDLQITLPDGQAMTEKAPVSWQVINGQQVSVPTRYQIDGQIASFVFPEGYDTTYPLIIDPTLLYSSYIGGGGFDETREVNVDSSGNIYLLGDTYSTHFLGQNVPNAGSSDLFIVKLNPTATQILYLTIVGTDELEYSRGLAVDQQGNAVVSLHSFADDFPMVNALYPTRTDPVETSILFKLNSTGHFMYSTYLPLRAMDATHNLALDSAGNAHVTGTFIGAIDPEGNWLGDQVGMFKISANGQSLLLGMQLGSAARPSHERGVALTVDAAGTMYMAGYQVDGDADYVFGTPNAHQPICGDVAVGASYCGHEAFIYIMDKDGNLTYASYHGGKGFDEPTAIATDGQGNVLLTGVTTSPDFPTRNALQNSCPISGDAGLCYQPRAFTSVVRIESVQSSMLYSTYWGSTEQNSYTEITGATMDVQGNAYVVGYTDGEHLPMRDPLQAELSEGICNLGGSTRNCFDAFVSTFTPTGQLGFSTYFGGALDEFTSNITRDDAGNILFVGMTEATNFPTTSGGIQPTNQPGTDGFLVKIGTGSIPPPTVTPTATLTPIPDAKKNYLPLVGGRR